MTKRDLVLSPESVPGLRARDLDTLLAAGLRTIPDLLNHFPKRYEDRRRFEAFPAQAGGGAVCLRGMVLDTQRKGISGKGFFEAEVEDLAGSGLSQFVCRWFNMPYLNSVLAAGQEVILFGRPKLSGDRLVIDHPEFEIVSEESRRIHLERIVPIYPNINGIPQRKLRELIFELVANLDSRSIGTEYDLESDYSRQRAYLEIHFPGELADAETARRFFAREEFFLQQVRVLYRGLRHSKLEGRILGKRTGLLTDFYQSLPFDLTEAQKRCVREIIGDMRSPGPMSRLLQGDVGSGKTFVAICAMLLAVESGCQAALMAPTQILAEQHYLTLGKWLSPLDLKIGLATSGRKENLEDAQIIIGTQALLFEGVEFGDLGLIVVDEQHKFGVAQRGNLVRRGVTPDLLIMTATPIPRTLTLTIYGDLEISVLDELPSGRGAISTGVRVKPKLREMTSFLKDQLAQGRQLYLVHPLVEESESLKVSSVTTEFPKWQKRLSPHPVSMLHGQMSTEEKEQVMTDFRDGKISALVSTSVIEVGVDVPNATVMIIFDAGRFGLAQLHQLRGRIGRGEHKSYCVLVSEGKNEEGLEKLQILAANLDGFKIAEHDLRLRGPGEVAGTRQSGAGELRFAEYLADPILLKEARSAAAELLQEDPDLVRYPNLKSQLEEAAEVEKS